MYEERRQQRNSDEKEEERRKEVGDGDSIMSDLRMEIHRMRRVEGRGLKEGGRE